MQIPNGTAAVKRLSAYMPLWLHMGRQADLYSKSEDLPYAMLGIESVYIAVGLTAGVF